MRAQAATERESRTEAEPFPIVFPAQAAYPHIMSFLTKLLILPMILCAALLAAPPTAKQCSDKASACAKKHNCSKTPDSKECQACKDASEKCMKAVQPTK
jgi:hypothetical protein